MNASDENEFWKILIGISKPKTETKWKLEDEEKTSPDDLKVEEELKTFFVSKIDKLKEGIDKNQTKDPLIKLEEIMANKNLRFSLKTVTEKAVSKVMQKMKEATNLNSVKKLFKAYCKSLPV